MKYTSLFGNREIFFSPNGDDYDYTIKITENSIYIYTKEALEDAIKLGLIEEVKPREIWIITSGDISINNEFFPSKESAEYFLVVNKGLVHHYEIVKFAEVIDG